MSLRSNVRSLLLFILTIICASKAAYTIESIGSASQLNILASISNPSLAGGTNFFVNAQTDASNNLLLGYYNLSTSPTANSGTVQSAIATSNAARVAASGDYVGIAYADTNGNIVFRLLQRTGTDSTVFSTVNTNNLAAGTAPWIGVHPNGWIVAYITSGNAIALASFDLTSGNALKVTTTESSASLLSLGTSSTGTSFVISYNKAENLNNNLRVQVCSMDATGTFTLPGSSIYVSQGNTLSAVTSRASIAPNGVALVSYIKTNGYYAYATITGGTPSGETVLQSSSTANSNVMSLSPNLFLALWEASNAIKGAIILANGTVSTQFSVIGSGVTSPAVAALGAYHFVIGWAATGSTVKSVTQHWAIQYCGDGFVTSNEACDSGPYCQADCTCPSGQGPLGTGCTAPGVPFLPIPPPSPPTDTPTAAPPVNQTPNSAPSTTPSDSTPTTPGSTPADPNQPNTVQNTTTPSLGASQTPLDPLDAKIGDLTVRYFIVIIIVPTVVVAAAIALLVVLLQRRKRRKGAKSGPFQGGDDGPTQYDQIYVNSSTLDAEPMDISRFTVDERLHIRYSDLQFLKEIGSGAFGKVFIGENLTPSIAHGKPKISVSDLTRLECGLIVLDTKLYKARVNLALKSQLQLISGIAKGLLHLHRNKIVHRDLAARNILLAHGKPKISDFGMSRQLEGVSKAGQTKNAIGPVRWMAPESLSDLSYSPQSDVWSFGCVIYEIIAQQEPHANSDVLTIGIKIRDNGYTPPLPKRVDPFIKKLLKNIWQKDPAKRPTMEQLATIIDDHLAKIAGEGDSSTTPSPIEASALDKSIHDEPSNNIGQSSEYDNIKENIATPGKLTKKGKSPQRDVHSNKKQAKHEKQNSQQQRMIQGEDAYDVINTSNQFKMEPIAEVPNSESSSSSSSSSEDKYHPVQVPKVPPRNKPSTPQRSLPPVPPRNSQTYNNNFTDDGAYDIVPK